jgi:phage terminase large subunit-like protein
LLSGRGGGKTFAAAYYVDKYARANAGHRIAIIAPTLGDARNTCVDGVTGLLSFNRRIEINRSSGHLLWPSGASWQNMRFGLRLGSRPHAIISTTPKPRPLLKQLLDDPNTVVTKATTADNPYLHEAVRGELYRLYEGTRIGRQELGGEIIDDNPDALWSRALIESTRVTRMPELERIIVSVDPSATSTGNECGIVVAGRSAFVDRVADGYLLDDLSLQGSPRAWQVIEAIDPSVSYRGVHARFGKRLRAEPIASRYEQGRVHHVGTFPEIEDQLCMWQPGDESPDRLDALVHAFTDLLIVKPEIEFSLV